MLKMKNENGITLAVLVVTIIILLILAGISINLGVDSIDSTKDRKLQAELEVVQQACMVEYTKAKQLNYLKEDSSVPENFIGEGVSVSNLPNISPESWVFTEEQTAGYKKYFRLNPQNLKKIGIQDAEHTYIVNYYTGEVYNETKKTSENLPLYIKSVSSHQTDDNTDTSSFVDNTTWGN